MNKANVLSTRKCIVLFLSILYIYIYVYIKIKIKVGAWAPDTNVDYWMMCMCHVDRRGVFCSTVLCTLGIYRIF